MTACSLTLSCKDASSGAVSHHNINHNSPFTHSSSPTLNNTTFPNEDLTRHKSISLPADFISQNSSICLTLGMYIKHDCCSSICTRRVPQQQCLNRKLMLASCRRKSVGDQVSQTITPDSQKSTLDKASESATSAGDKVAGAVQPSMFALTHLRWLQLLESSSSHSCLHTD